MGAWLWWAWLQIWPNLAANVLWVPAVAIHHVLMKRHTNRLHKQQSEHIQKLFDQREEAGNASGC